MKTAKTNDKQRPERCAPLDGSVGYGVYNLVRKKWVTVFGQRLEFPSARKAYAWRVKLTKGNRDEATNILRTILQIRPLNTEVSQPEGTL